MKSDGPKTNYKSVSREAFRAFMHDAMLKSYVHDKDS